MDPVTVILGALSIAGARVGDQVIKDGYAGLKALIVRKFGAAKPRLEEHIDAYSQDPDTWEKPVAKSLREAGSREFPADWSGRSTRRMGESSSQIASKAAFTSPAASP